MGSLAFYGCEGLLQAEIPGSLRELASSVFGDCVSLKRIVLHEGLEAVSIYAFSNCRSLSELELPRGLASVGYGSFQGCAGLTRLTIPKDTRLEFDGRTVPHQTTPFADSVSLTDIQVDGENPYYEAQDGGLYEKGCGNLIFWFGTGERAVIPAFVSRLAVGAFESRKDLKEFAVEPGNTKLQARLRRKKRRMQPRRIARSLRRMQPRRRARSLRKPRQSGLQRRIGLTAPWCRTWEGR